MQSIFKFENVNQYDMAVEIAHSAILYWKKVRQDAQGKICLQCDGSRTHYSVEEAERKLREALQVLVEIENTPHPEWNGDKIIFTGKVESHYSIIVNNSEFLQ